MRGRGHEDERSGAAFALHRPALLAGAAAAVLGVVAIRFAGAHWARANAWESAIGTAQRRHGFLVSPFGHALDVVLLAAVPLAAAVVVLLLIRLGDRLLALRCLVALGGAFCTTELLKHTLASRPGVSGALVRGYPSGHTTLAVATGLAWIAGSTRTRRLVAATGFSALVAVGVVVDGWHLPTDAAGAALVASAWLLGVFAFAPAPPGGRPAPRVALEGVVLAAAICAILLVHAGLPSYDGIGRRTVEASIAVTAVVVFAVVASAYAIAPRRASTTRS